MTRYHLAPRTTSRLACEQLEHRNLLCTVTIFDPNPDQDNALVPGTLRNCIEMDNNPVVTFSGMGSRQIALDVARGPIRIQRDVIIMDMGGRDAGSPQVFVDGGGGTRIFDIDDGLASHIDVTLDGVGLVNGNGANGSGPSPDDGLGGAILNWESLTLQNSTVSGNTALDEGGGLWSGPGSHVEIWDSDLDDNQSTTSRGGAFYQFSGSSVINGTTFYDNRAQSGGAIAVEAILQPASVSVTDSSFVANRAENAAARAVGGAVSIHGFGSVSIAGSTFSYNDAIGPANPFPLPSRGGGLYAYADNATMSTETLSLQITGTMVENNEAFQGAGLSLRGQESTLISTVVQASTISGNTGSASVGVLNYSNDAATPYRASLTLVDTEVFGNYASIAVAGLHNVFGAELVLESTTVRDNVSVGPGAGVNSLGSMFAGVGSNPRLVIRSSAIHGNTSLSAHGGGVASTDTNLEIFQSTISGNSAMGHGGGAYIVADPMYAGGPYDTTATIDRTTIAFNSAAMGSTAGLHAALDASVSIFDSILSDNSATDLGTSGGATVTVQYSLVEQDGTGVIVDGVDGNIEGASALLGMLADNGGPTPSHALLNNSPALDAGRTSVGMGELDQRGFGPRNVGGTIDLGPYEYGAFDVARADFDDDDSADCADVDALTTEIAVATNNPQFDLTDDGLVNVPDLIEWLRFAGARPEHFTATGGNPFLQADGNLDGVVDGLDFVIWNSNKFASSTFCSGDFSPDGFADGQDFIVWNSLKFTSAMSDTGRIRPTSKKLEVAWKERAEVSAIQPSVDRLPVAIAIDCTHVEDLKESRNPHFNDVILAGESWSEALVETPHFCA